ncbi:DUF1146 domain-containing protein [Alicyclobacillus sp. ALC3]|uniref:DUF1146 domain-containing protein n=1 Tax=Alicyclobacillus sp. ALC3 TaxID=2796143 RepID=UPI002378D99D|nr:DUF1146 domain-containing protein [Alicyclobacillus sp. ALC3]WDL95218.1 DUF1146 domain-containing protein [Alicyclobacillus sp. ALC3]
MPNGTLPGVTSANAALVGIDGMVFIAAFLGGMYLTWRAIGILRWDKFTVDPFGPQARLLRVLIALVGGLIFGWVIVLFILATQLLKLV